MTEAEYREYFPTENPRNKRKHPSFELCCAIEQAYRLVMHERIAAVQKIGLKYNISRSFIYSIAGIIGVSRMHGKSCIHWKAAEDAILSRTGHLSPGRVQEILYREGHTRSLSAITNRRTRLFVTTNRPYLTLSDTSRILGISRETVRRFVQNEKIVSIKSGHNVLIHEKSLRKFILANPSEVNPHRMEWLYIFDLLTSPNFRNGDISSFKDVNQEILQNRSQEVLQ